MKSVIVCVCLLVYNLNYPAYGDTKSTCKCDVEGYYWRDYVGIIPTDAVPGGANKIAYIGQALNPSMNNHPAAILPGIINGNTKRMSYEYNGGDHSGTQDVKILCSAHPEQLQWVAVRAGDSLLTVNKDKQFVVGGHDTDHMMLIGRITESGNVLIGKLAVNIARNIFGSLYVTDSGRAWEEKGFYDVLVYDQTASISTPNQIVCNQRMIHINVFN